MHALELWDVFESELLEMLDGERQYATDVVTSMLEMALDSGQLAIVMRVFVGRRGDEAAARASQSPASDPHLSSETPRASCAAPPFLYLRSFSIPKQTPRARAGATQRRIELSCSRNPFRAECTTESGVRVVTSATDRGRQVGLCASYSRGAARTWRPRWRS